MRWASRRPLPEADALLLHAHARRKASLCPCGCGFPADITLDHDGDFFEIDDGPVCQVQAAWAQWRADHPEQEQEPGSLPHPVLDEKAYRIAKARMERAEADG